jgi:fibronectin type 3 domain-containing protein
MLEPWYKVPSSLTKTLMHGTISITNCKTVNKEFFMKNFYRFLGFTLFAVIMLTACPDLSDSDDPIESVIINVTAPVTSMPPNPMATGNGNFSISTVSWSPTDSLFKAETPYTALVTLSVDTGYTFYGMNNAAINGKDAVISNNTGKSVTLSYQFPKTDASSPDQLPMTPLNVSTSNVTATSIRINWSSVSGVTLPYKIYRSDSADGDYALKGSGLSYFSTYYTDDGLDPETTYYYKVSAVNNYGESPLSPPVSVTTLSLIPVAPTGVYTSNIGVTSIRINWSAVSGVTSPYYNIYRGDNADGDYTFRGSTIYSFTSYTDDGLIPETTYYYKVSAINGYGESPLSSPVSVTTSSQKPAAPTGVSTSNVTSASIRINWSSVSGVTSPYYNIYRSDNADGDYTLRGSSPYSYFTYYTDDGLAAETTYYYKVSAVNAYGEGPLSSSVSAKTLALPKPAAPAGLSTSVVFYEITISWTYVLYVTGYNIYRSTTPLGEYSLIDTTTTTRYVDSGLEPNTSYYYKVSSYNDNGEGPMSASNNIYATTFIANAGKSPETAISISSSGTNGTFPSGMDEVWYTFTRTGAGVLYAIDRSNPSGIGIGMGDIVVDVLHLDLSIVELIDKDSNITRLENIDIGQGATDPNNIGVNNWEGYKIYVKVKPKGGSFMNKGTFQLFFVAI